MSEHDLNKLEKMAKNITTLRKFSYYSNILSTIFFILVSLIYSYNREPLFSSLIVFSLVLFSIPLLVRYYAFQKKYYIFKDAKYYTTIPEFIKATEQQNESI